MVFSGVLERRGRREGDFFFSGDGDSWPGLDPTYTHTHIHTYIELWRRWMDGWMDEWIPRASERDEEQQVLLTSKMSMSLRG